MPSLGVYISVPFCRAKCSYCNFASGVFGEERIDAYVTRVQHEMAQAAADAARAGGLLPAGVDSVFLGGGTPSLLRAAQMRALFVGLREYFEVARGAEITLECAPGQLEDTTLDEFQRQGGNRVSLGVQSFADRESRAVGRMHTREICLGEIARLRAAGIPNLNLDLIAGLPHQTLESWRESVEVAIGTGVPHVSVYMLEVDADSRLGREMISAGQRYGAGNTPGEDEVAEWYGWAAERLEAAGVQQYEISNFARAGFASQHNMKYWRREPYLGFGLDAHSMLRAPGGEAVRWANPEVLDNYLAGSAGAEQSLPVLGRGRRVDRVGRTAAFEEALYLGLRMNCGLDVNRLRDEFGAALVEGALCALADAAHAGLIEIDTDTLRLTAAGRMVSNEVFARLLIAAV